MYNQFNHPMVNPHRYAYSQQEHVNPQHAMYHNAIYGDLAPNPMELQNEFQTQMLKYLRNPGPSPEYIQGVIGSQDDAISQGLMSNKLALQDQASASGFSGSGALQRGLRKLGENASLAKAGARRSAMMDAERMRLNNTHNALALAGRYTGGLGGGRSRLGSTRTGRGVSPMGTPSGRGIIGSSLGGGDLNQKYKEMRNKHFEKKWS